jgi:hypothetical protein
MRCWELTDKGITEGLRIDVPGQAQPKVNITSDGELYFPIDPELTPIIKKGASEHPPDSVPKMLCATVMPDGESLTSCVKGSEALVRIDVRAARGGRVILSAANDRGEVLEGRRVTTAFGPFPPLGISVLLPMSLPFDKQPWHMGQEHLELAIVMIPGSEFRIFRTRPPAGVRPVDFVKWTGAELRINKRREESLEITERI